MYITSILADSRVEAIAFVRDPRKFGGYGNYYVTGLTINIGEDISSNFPFHIRWRIENGGIKAKTKGYMYEYKKNNPRRPSKGRRPS